MITLTYTPVEVQNIVDALEAKQRELAALKARIVNEANEQIKPKEENGNNNS